MRRHKVVRVFVDFEKEENWLNEMSAKGLHFISYAFPQYLFEEGTPGEYTYRIELLSKPPSHIEGKAYIDFVEESGAECVDTFHFWAYFRRKTADGPFDLYTDNSSKIRHYQRVMALMGAVAAFLLALGVWVLLMGGLGLHSLPAVPAFAFVLFLARLVLSYRTKAGRLRKEMSLRE